MAGARLPTGAELDAARAADEALLDQWPAFAGQTAAFEFVPRTLTGVPLASSIPNAWSRHRQLEADPVEKGRAVAGRALAQPYPYNQLGADCLAPGPARDICDYLAAVHREELRRRAALRALAAEGDHPLSDTAGKRLRELGAPQPTVAASVTARVHRDEFRAAVAAAVRTKELRSRRREVRRLNLCALGFLEPYVAARDPQARPIYGYASGGHRRHVPQRASRPRPDLRQRWDAPPV
jgi:hypothetical protein